MRTITLVTQKGGAGKTTVATSLAVAAQQAGETVAAFDLDPQGSLVEWGRIRAKAEEPAITDPRLPVVERFPLDRIAQIKTMLSSLEKKGVTLTILDTAGADNPTTHAAMEASTFCLVPIRPTRLDLLAVRATVQAIMRSGKQFAFVLNQCSTIPRNNRANDTATGLASIGFMAEPLLLLRNDYQDAFAAGMGVTEYAGDGKAADEIRQLWKWVSTQSETKA
ncbi:ParA family protein [Methylobacterium sp. J-048]|uniref:ParA family protein n=1 Tax=unclassified Methylobacterium TaxID=2615210 RepID=UPI001FB9FB49|nr:MULTISPECIES: ParA family protein [unclassified Methylobacterium]MCJ2061066.1 ParA family protein [Methylobacterium sp. J-048]MCJ2094930.1 ParA family protein [Methylobacterium sp. J-072]